MKKFKDINRLKEDSMDSTTMSSPEGNQFRGGYTPASRTFTEKPQKEPMKKYKEVKEESEIDIPKDAPSVEAIAKKHGVSVAEIEKQLKIGMAVEAEHGKNKGSEREIAMDHLNEKPNYYTKLKKYVEETEVNEMLKPKMSSLDKWRASATEREKMHNDIEKNRQANASQGKENMSGAINRLSKSLNKEEIEQIQEYESKSGVYKHKGTYGTEYKGDIDPGRPKFGDELTHLNTVRTKNLEKGMDVHFGRAGKIKEEAEMENTIEEGAVPSTEKTVALRHKSSGKEIRVTQNSIRAYRSLGYHPIREEAEQIEEESNEKHWDKGYEYAKDHAIDSGFVHTASARKKQMLADNPHKKGTPEHSEWHKGALEGHSSGKRELRGESVEHIEEGQNKQVEGGDPCWKNYQMVGKKMKNGKEVPNCVPVKEAKDEREYGYEGDMALNQLATLTRCADMIKELLKPDTDMPEWVQSKITLATDYIQTAADYMYSELKEEAEQLEEAPVVIKTNKEIGAKVTSVGPGGKETTIKTDPAYAKAEQEKKKMEEATIAGTSGWKKSPGTVTDKSGAKHSPMSRARDLARLALNKKAKSLKPVKEEKEESRKAEIVKNVMKSAKKKKSDGAGAEKFESEPVLSSEIQKQ
jgi:hypothetical protein